MNVSRETQERLETYASLLRKWNQTINLISRRDIDDLWHRHIEDSLQLVPLMPVGIPFAVDLGSGGGLPGLVLAIATDCHFHLVESDRRKSAFLREAARACAAPITVHAERANAVTLPRARLVTARALAPLIDLIGLAAPFLAPEGMLLAPKGRSVEAELTQAAERWHMRVTRTKSVTDASAEILQITEVTHAGHLS